MSGDLYIRLAGILLTIAVGAALQRSKLMRADAARADEEPAFALAQLATYVLVPALLFRTMARLDLGQMPWPVVQAYFVPVLLCSAALFAGYRFQLASIRAAAASRGMAVNPMGPDAPAGPATRTMAAVYGNAVQLGIPLAAAMFGEAGLAIHIALVSLHGLMLLTSLTLLAEYDVAQSRGKASLLSTLSVMTRNAVLHPVVLPVLLGLGYQWVAPPLPAVVDQTLAGLGQAVVPLCLLLIGMNLAHFGLRSTWRPAVSQVVFKLLLLPAVVLGIAHSAFGLRGLPLQVAVMMAALPAGTNALIFAQRYRLLQAEATSAIVLSTLAFAFTAPLWVAILARLS
jgi:malonate transporter and related proteins